MMAVAQEFNARNIFGEIFQGFGCFTAATCGFADSWELLDDLDFWFESGTARPEHVFQLWRPEAHDASGFVAFAEEQLALVTEYRFHGIYFG